MVWNWINIHCNLKTKTASAVDYEFKKCHKCKENEARVSCEKCCSFLCQRCDNYSHKKQTKKHHKRINVEEEKAKVWKQNQRMRN